MCCRQHVALVDDAAAAEGAGAARLHQTGLPRELAGGGVRAAHNSGLTQATVAAAGRRCRRGGRDAGACGDCDQTVETGCRHRVVSVDADTQLGDGSRRGLVSATVLNTVDGEVVPATGGVTLHAERIAGDGDVLIVIALHREAVIIVIRVCAGVVRTFEIVASGG